MRYRDIRIVAAIEARMGSRRLPGKVMMNIMDKPVLGYLIERMKRAKLIDQIVVATSVNPENDVIETYCRKMGIACFRGSEDDVLTRIYEALKFHHADVGVDIYGDAPLIEPEIVDGIIKFYMANTHQYDFVSNDLKTSFPPGTEAEVFSLKALEDAMGRDIAPDIREHGTLYIRQHPELYRLYNVEAPRELYYPDMEIELDTEDDFTVIKSIIEDLYPKNPDFSIYEIIEFLKKHPEVSSMNKDVHRRWKQFRQT